MDEFDMMQEERLWPTVEDEDTNYREPEEDMDYPEDEGENTLDDYEDDGDALASAGMGTDEDYE